MNDIKLIQDGAELSLRRQLVLTAKLSAPAIMAQLSTILMQYIDASMVGRLGADQSASVGLMNSSLWMFWGVCSTITMGFSVAPTEVNQFVITSKELDVRGSRLQNRKFQDVIDLVNTWNFEDAQAAFDFVDSRDPSYRKGVLTFKK